VRLLRDAPVATLRAAAADPSLVARVDRLAAGLRAVKDAAQPDGPSSVDHPTAFLCAEFAVHESLPIYSGGLGVLAGDLLKQASDIGVPMIGVGLLYRTGYFHQRLDTSGMQHEYWRELDPEDLPGALVTDADGMPVTVTVPINGQEVAVQVWRVDVGRVPLLLLDTDLEENDAIGRWVTSRLYEGNREVRLAQYAVLGVAGPKVLRRLGIRPARYHLNEGHAALAAVELVREQRAHGIGADEAWERVRSQLVFTTHTPVAAGNETYGRTEILHVLGGIIGSTGEQERVLAMGRDDPGDAQAPSGLSTLAVRASASVNGVSRRHGEVARAMWQHCWPGRTVEDVPVTHVTNGVHVATWMHEPMRRLLDEHLGAGWLERADDPATWSPLDHVPDDELWATRDEARRQLIEMARVQATRDRLRRGEDVGYAAATVTLDPDALTIGFARRVASYKRLHLLGMEPQRTGPLLDGDRPVQLIIAGKAHPHDELAKRTVQGLFQRKGDPGVAGRVVFLEDYDLTMARYLVAGCDVWVNLPRPPMEASGTSGMKAALNGGLNLSVLDGWWAEMYDGSNGWAIDGTVVPDEAEQDRVDANAFLDILEREAIAAFYERDDRGVPARWVAMVKRSLQTIAPQVTAERMLRDYVARIYAPATAGNQFSG
jgi:starch phosphorylase